MRVPGFRESQIDISRIHSSCDMRYRLLESDRKSFFMLLPQNRDLRKKDPLERGIGFPSIRLHSSVVLKILDRFG